MGGVLHSLRWDGDSQRLGKMGLYRRDKSLVVLRRQSVYYASCLDLYLEKGERRGGTAFFAQAAAHLQHGACLPLEDLEPLASVLSVVCPVQLLGHSQTHDGRW